MTSRKDRPPRGTYDGPNHAHLTLKDGGQIRCSIAEDPQRDKNGNRVFLLQPVRGLEPHEQATGISIDRLPGRSTARVVWEDMPDLAGAATEISWEDEDGTHHRAAGTVQRGPVQNWDGHAS